MDLETDLVKEYQNICDIMPIPDHPTTGDCLPYTTCQKHENTHGFQLKITKPHLDTWIQYGHKNCFDFCS